MAQYCDPFSAQACPNPEVLVDRIQLIPASHFEQQCRKHDAYFKCMYKYGGSCDAHSRLKWEPLRFQTDFICGTGKTAYLNHADCWSNSTSGKLVDCSRDFQDDIFGEPCGALTKYVSCAEASISSVCRKGAEEVMKNMAEKYTYPMRRAFKCLVEAEQDAVTTEVISTDSHVDILNNVNTISDFLTTVTASTQAPDVSTSSGDVTTDTVPQNTSVWTGTTPYDSSANSQHQTVSALYITFFANFCIATVRMFCSS
ncbi:uncharacterized protein LOC121366294 isoform X2 [Gigantopelta aegis]|nr:uncharacterized protein LOC121366294 isoform X2 [Gigantopelta aegis]